MHSTLFIQSPPMLGNQYGDDPVEHVLSWLSHNHDPRRLQAHARRLAMTLGRALQLALLVEAGEEAPACRFAAAPLDLLVDINSEDSARLIE